ncbi:ankyrin repeat domain protein [Wolbachia endosymbiont of Armadillidium vulgare str. wVulC]|uniref:Ankyrin repeat domain-containing protein n=1 Tax=Wolbachia endosymbiont of Armadillidium arcangelii TaxID=3158571 RepID=A0AAU7Q1Q7_9RICK|nr:ankyrin repeat domain-containing protein [Wolbachia endosymbiont of Armadillidium vulgare]KLT22484.1 ankyrin repeat domain protein [Wolbachia endosymbiont of Armadillidium vulgare str. wVulC]OJH32857.1 Ankyrin repeats (3 copies) [Wolbachia endosymbiont of Armadillidium vulgare]
MNRKIWLYSVLHNALYKVDEDNDLDISNVIKKIKERLESGMRTSSKENYYKYLYTSWKKKGFDINHKFDLKDYDGFPVDSLFSIAINCKPCVLPNLAQVLIKAGANVQSEKGYLHACALIRSPDVLKALIEAGVNDSPHEHYGGNTALDCVTKLYGTDKSINCEDCCKILIKHTLEKNPNIEVPNSVKNNKELAQCWNACEANNEGWELITPSTETQVVSAQKANKSSCSIQ